jgi:hypothetical protein
MVSDCTTAAAVHLKQSGMTGALSALGDSFPETGFLKTDFGFLDFGRETTHFKPLLGRFDAGLRPPHVDVFSLFCDLGKNGDFRRRDLGKSPEDGHIRPDFADLVTKFSDLEHRKKMTMARQHAEFTFCPRRDDFFDILTKQQLVGSDDFE